MTSSLDYDIKLQTASQGYDRVTCWQQARAGAIPPASPGENPTVILTMQKIRVNRPDDYEAIHSLCTTDLGLNWTKPVEQAGFARVKVDENEKGPIERTVCDFWPKWHSKAAKMLGTGGVVYYTATGQQVRRTAVPYAVYDEAAHQWNAWRTLDLPDAPRFFRTRAGCTQRVDLPSGEILLPIYYSAQDSNQFFSTVLRCSFDGVVLEYLEHGDEVTSPAGRGLYEPSLAHYNNRYFLALRNDARNYVAASDDGLHFSAPRPWQFDNGDELGSYNTQCHWVAHSGGLYLVYTRRGLNNDHVFRHRAPLLMAKVDTERLCIIRDTERIIIPERGARLGNFGITEVSENETWIIEAEGMQNSNEWAEVMREKVKAMDCEIVGPSSHMCQECECFGSDNSVWTARLLWNQPNKISF